MVHMAHKYVRFMQGPALLLVLTIAAILAGCGASGGGGPYGAGSSGSSSSSTSTTGTSGNTSQTSCASSSAPICTRSVQVKGSAQNALVTPAGKTLYYFTPDSATKVACTSTGGCTTTWPPLMASSSSVAPIAGLSGTLATVSRTGGSQITYNGHPLYAYAADTAPGDTKGEGLFGKWFVATVNLAPGNGGSNGGYNNGYGGGYNG